MSLANHKVIAAWKDGKKAVNGRKSLSTDGKWLYSYRLAIGFRTSNGICVLGNYTSGGGSFRSVTTSCHISSQSTVLRLSQVW